MLTLQIYSSSHGMKALAPHQRRSGTAWCWLTGATQTASIKPRQPPISVIAGRTSPQTGGATTLATTPRRTSFYQLGSTWILLWFWRTSWPGTSYFRHSISMRWQVQIKAVAVFPHNFWSLFEYVMHNQGEDPLLKWSQRSPPPT